ncbi:hypothetical protein [Burkholderia sp. LMG 32019]|uniref:hypothetical protein n=1 Tax=Burkholderia sp. LMG 32019 TaxID=3158173 RepID=UPI003C30D72C
MPTLIAMDGYAGYTITDQLIVPFFNQIIRFRSRKPASGYWVARVEYAMAVEQFHRMGMRDAVAGMRRDGARRGGTVCDHG